MQAAQLTIHLYLSDLYYPRLGYSCMSTVIWKVDTRKLVTLLFKIQQEMKCNFIGIPAFPWTLLLLLLYAHHSGF